MQDGERGQREAEGSRADPSPASHNGTPASPRQSSQDHSPGRTSTAGASASAPGSEVESKVTSTCPCGGIQGWEAVRSDEVAGMGRHACPHLLPPGPTEVSVPCPPPLPPDQRPEEQINSGRKCGPAATAISDGSRPPAPALAHICQLAVCTEVTAQGGPVSLRVPFLEQRKLMYTGLTGWDWAPGRQPQEAGSGPHAHTRCKCQAPSRDAGEQGPAAPGA